MSDHAGTIPDAAASTSGPRLPDGRVPILISSDTAELVVEEAAAIRDWVRAHPEVDPARVGAHLLRTRPARRHRALVTAVDHAQLADALDALAAGRVHPDVVRGAGAATPRRIAYTYPGQGSQRPGMGASYYRLSEHYRREVDACHVQSMRLFGASPRDYVLGELDADDPSATDVRTVQPALFMQMAGLTAMWDAAGATPALTVGHSQGEIAAAYRSGAMTLSDALTIVTIRARLVHELSPRGHTMAVVGIDVDECEDMLARNSGWAQLSVVNSAHILCISGKREAVLGMVDTLSAQGTFAKEIRVEYPAHTSIVSEYQPAFLDALGTYLENESMLAGTMPCIGATLGGAVDETMSLGDYWFWNLRNRVRFDKAMADAVVSHRADFFIEMSEHPTLLLAMGETLSDVDEAGLAARPVIGTSRRDAAGLEEFTRNVAAVAVADSGFRWDALLPADTAVGIPEAPLRGFPNTVMRRVHLWADREAGRDDEVNAPGWAARQAGNAVHRLVETWRPCKRRSLLPPRRIAVLDPTGQCADLAREIEAAAQHQGTSAVVVGAGDQPVEADAAVLLMGPSGTKPDGAQEHLADILVDGRWRGGLDPIPAQFWWVTVGGERVVGADPTPDLVHAALTSALRCAAADHPSVRFRHLDLDPASEGDPGADVVTAVHVADEPELAVRDGALYVKRLEQADSGEAAGGDVGGDIGREAAPDLTHVLITGGTGKLGLEFADHLAASGAGRITLVSRSGGTADVTRRIEALRRRHDTVVEVARCDIGDEGALAGLAAALPEPVTLVLHAAVNYVAAPAGDITRADLDDAVRAKVTGLRSVLAAIPTADDVRVLLCSSLAATLGGRDQALYALGNRMLDVIAAELRADGTRAASIQWGLWRVQGPLDDAGVARVQGAGVVPMTPSSALTVGLSDLSADSIVVSADFAELRDVLALLGSQRLLADIPDDPHPAVVTAAPAPPAEVTATLYADAGPASSVSTAAGAGDAAGSASPRPTTSVADLLRSELALTMGLDPAQVDLDPDLPLVALGLDSLQTLDLRKRVKTVLDQDLPIEAILGGATLREVVEMMG
ncbi:nocobactin polyketide synthase NbtC [Gordonia sp. ABSL11-1]|uniref:nocobactin polyketide synthase NbtC n=1 Tax=Gordonia sp. ABSL11-1 TaxID=3053924 RepID=UPI0025731DA3|nr:nocobactin polyketide synthase NbtC [Gordonia sp. ABSL11-1]MDL9946668.1 nocobactin polyketide synthase NbtC [Gordonia sp. ABSL11-1]